MLLLLLPQSFAVTTSSFTIPSRTKHLYKTETVQKFPTSHPA
jgi:hypothetical protein